MSKVSKLLLSNNHPSKLDRDWYFHVFSGLEHAKIETTLHIEKEKGPIQRDFWQSSSVLESNKSMPRLLGALVWHMGLPPKNVSTLPPGL